MQARFVHAVSVFTFFMLFASAESAVAQVSFNKLDHTTGRPPGDLAVADINRDGYPDIAYVLPGTNRIGVMYLSQTSAFQQGGEFELLDNPIWVKVADWNRDGIPDLFIGGEGKTMIIYFGDENGNYSPLNRYFTSSSLPRRDVGIADFDGNGHLDLAIMDTRTEEDGREGGFIWVTQHALDGSFGVNSPQDILHLTQDGGQVFAQDMDADSRPDLVVRNGTSVRVYWADSAGRFTDERFTSIGGPFADNTTIAIGDPNGDTRPDIAVASFGNCGSGCNVNRVVLFVNNGGRKFQLRSQVAAPGAEKQSLAVADINNDQRHDLLWTEFNPGSADMVLRYALGNGDGTFRQAQIAFHEDDMLGLEVLSMDRSVTHDVVFSSPASQDVTVAINLLPNSGCTPPTVSSSTVRICVPTSGSTTSSPFKLWASAASPNNIFRMEAWLDGVKKFETFDDQMQVWMPASSAAHRLTIVALDYSNRRSSSTRFFNNSGGCTPGANRTVRICSPGNGSTVSSPVSITAVASTAKINGMKIYVDGSVRYSTAGPGIKTTLNLRAGTRQLTVKAWDRFGSFSKSITVNVR